MSDVWHTNLDMDVYSAADYSYEYYSELGEGSISISYETVYSWLIPQDDGSYIIITGCDYRSTMKFTSPTTFYFTILGYQHFTEEEVNAVLAAEKERVDTYNSQLENDL